MLIFFDFKFRKYKKIKYLGMPLMTEVGKAIPKELFLKSAEDLRMVSKDNKIITENKDEISFILDRAIHDVPWPEQRWIEYICEHKIQDYTQEQQFFLKAHLQPFISLYEALKIDYRRGVYLRDLFNGKELFLMDIGFGTTAKKGMLLATRVITFEGLNFTAGAPILFRQEDKKQLVENFTFLYEKKKNEMTWEKMMRKYAPYFFIEYRKRDYTVYFANVTEDSITPFSLLTAAWDYARKKNLIKHSDDFPVEQCLINSNWQKTGLASMVITRSQKDGKLIVGVFLVDIFCLGLKDTFFNANIPADQFEDIFLRKYYQNTEPVTIGINYAKEIIFGAIDYARKLGFEPQKNFKLSKYVLGTEKLTYQHNIKFGGPEGKPLYIAGPYDDYKKIVRQLTELLGEGGFHFILPSE
ncbi:hypothetical protein AUJ66_07050 [Candidatus Desantisbacteria bacterium CG1_02_38_46]|nr:MAG: hypothetical protein AUJ66_07050 [Candidatus Desantisbacteria bacterium CG1_02_38_46]PIZ15159.1 MAG: hypothetical protein COY51_06105 [Candidatus Desantisbacteria bacterium CG_4_10_14_0_8_um_filter_39_17]